MENSNLNYTFYTAWLLLLSLLLSSSLFLNPRKNEGGKIIIIIIVVIVKTRHVWFTIHFFYCKLRQIKTKKHQHQHSMSSFLNYNSSQWTFTTNLHISVNYTAMWRLWEWTIRRLVSYQPIQCYCNLCFIHWNVVLCLVETLGDECTQPVA